MSFFSALLNANAAYSYEDAFGAKDCTSASMRDAISDWFNLYFNTEKTETEDPCQRIPYTVVNKLSKTMFGEYAATSKDEFTQAIIDALDKKRKSAAQMALIGGESAIKPVPDPSGFTFTVIPRKNILVFGRGPEGEMTDIGTIEKSIFGGFYYTLLERRTVDERGYLTIRNTLYKSMTDWNIGSPVSLDTLPKYTYLAPEYTYPEPLHSPGVIVLKTPMTNCVDGSDDGVSVYAAAAGLIHNININEAQINGEFERGESRIIASSSMLRQGVNGERGIHDHVFVGFDEDPELVGVTIFSPAFREQSFLARKQEYLRNVESVIGLKRGLLSEVEAEERTATEITSSAGDYNLTVIDFQAMWESAVKQAIVLCGKLGRMYKVVGARDLTEDDVSIDWGNGILYDEDKTWEDYKGMVAAGLLKPEIALAWRFNMPAETESDLAAVREKYMPAIGTEEDGEA